MTRTTVLIQQNYKQVTAWHLFISFLWICSNNRAFASARREIVPALAFSVTNRIKHREARYFTVKDCLPPLETMPSSSLPSYSNSTFTMTMPYSDTTSEPLPVVYSNDPKVLNRWLVDHVPMEGCAVGFDTEVRATLALLFRIVGIV